MDSKNARKYHEEGLSWEKVVVGAIALDDWTLQLTLENPTPYFLELLNHYSWFPAHPPTIEKFGAFENKEPHGLVQVIM